MNSPTEPERARSGRDRRREPRRPARGEVRLWVSTETPTVQGRLLDISRNGFRAAHNQKDLAAGEEIIFQHASGAGRARGVWNRIHAGKVQSGFLLV